MKDKLTSTEVSIAKAAWNQIENGSSEYERLKASDPSFKFDSCIEWFYKTFYERLFEIHPVAKPMFKDPTKQGQFLVALFSFVFTAIDSKDNFNKRLASLANSHNEKGVKATEYGLIGTVMFYTLKKCLGADYTREVDIAWKKIFSRMLKVIVPLAVDHELKSHSVNQKLRLETFSKDSYIFSHDSGKK